MLIVPKSLHKGARVAVLGASSPSSERKGEDYIQAVKDMGLEPVLFKSATAHHGYLAGTDAVRAADLNAAFADKSIEGILTIRGGYGAARLLPLLDWDVIRANPKFFMGYSDVTALHTAFNQIGGFVTYHMSMVGAWYDGMDAYTAGFVKALLFGGRPENYDNPADAAPRATLVSGKAEGELCGGNLSLLASSMGTPYEFDCRGKILFIEEVGESPYRIDGMLTTLRNGGKFADAAGVIFGQFTKCEGDEDDKMNGLSVDQVLEELVVPAGKPAFKGVMCGHGHPSLALPLGMRFRMDADACTFEQE